LINSSAFVQGFAFKGAAKAFIFVRMLASSALNQNRAIDSQESMFIEKIESADASVRGRSRQKNGAEMLRNYHGNSKDF
jgi:hypothetical protein